MLPAKFHSNNRWRVQTRNCISVTVSGICHHQWHYTRVISVVSPTKYSNSCLQSPIIPQTRKKSHVKLQLAIYYKNKWVYSRVHLSSTSCMKINSSFSLSTLYFNISLVDPTLLDYCTGFSLGTIFCKISVSRACNSLITSIRL